jgi:hypothetical protein
MDSFFLGFEKRADMWQIPEDFAIHMQKTKHPLARDAEKLITHNKVPEKDSDREQLRKEYVKFHKQRIGEMSERDRAEWEKMKGTEKYPVSKGMSAAAGMGIMGGTLGSVLGWGAGLPLRAFKKTRGIGKALFPAGGAVGAVTGGIGGYKMGRHNPYHKLSKEDLERRVKDMQDYHSPALDQMKRLTEKREG